MHVSITKWLLEMSKNQSTAPTVSAQDGSTSSATKQSPTSFRNTLHNWRAAWGRRLGSNMPQLNLEHVKTVGDIVSVTTVGAVLAGWMPIAASLAAFIYTGIRIYETRTIQNFIKRIRRWIRWRSFA